LTHEFDQIADTYDRWYDTSEGRIIFHAELECLRSLYEKCPGRWLEVGTGTGRFSSMLGVAEGIDPSPRMLEIASGRGIRTYEGYAENLPFPVSSFDGVLMALALCFVSDSRKALEESRRVLRPCGCLLIGIIPADSPWGREYMEKATRGHPVYTQAHFLTADETVRLTRNAGFTLADAASTLFWKPGEMSQTEPQIKNGIVPEAGFLGLLFKKTASEHLNADNMRGRG